MIYFAAPGESAQVEEFSNMKTPSYERHLNTAESLEGFSSISSGFWRTAEQLRNEAVEKTAGQAWAAHWTIHSAICLYHAALDCFINEEMTITAILTKAPLGRRHEIQGMTLRAEKLEGFYSYFGLTGPTQEIKRRTLLLAGLRNRLAHHWPEMRDLRDYPVQVIDALKDAKIERVNTSWTAQCSDVRLAKWVAEVAHAFVEEWWSVGRGSDALSKAQWDFGPNTVYPSDKLTTPKS